MAIEWEILGQPGADNALHAIVDSGQSRDSFLFDCGESCLRSLRSAEIQSIRHLCFSHFHMDHVAGFDGFFRLNYNRPDVPVEVWGPSDTLAVMHHRFHGWTWNLHHDQPGEWIVTEIDERELKKSRFRTRDAFAEERLQNRPYLSPLLLQEKAWRLEARLLPHGSIFSTAYRIVESPRHNIDPSALRDSTLIPGPWLKSLLDAAISDDASISVGEQPLRVGDLRKQLLTTTPGTSLAWVTDFRVEPGTADWKGLVDWLRGTTYLVMECQYRASDDLLAFRNAHMTTQLVGQIAAEAEVCQLTLQHLSRRYMPSEWLIMRDEVRTIFPHTELPKQWQLKA